MAMRIFSLKVNQKKKSERRLSCPPANRMEVLLPKPRNNPLIQKNLLGIATH